MARMSRGVTFRFNTVFYPEYLSTILISLALTMMLFLFTTQDIFPKAPPQRREAHLIASGLLYATVVAELLRRTLVIRGRNRRFQLVTRDGQPVLRRGHEELPIADIIGLREQIGSLFGRRVRQMTVERKEGNWEFDDSLFGYDQLRRALYELSPQAPPDAGVPETDDARLAARWADRHLVFPVADSYLQHLAKLLVRLFCLIPVGVVELAANVAMLITLRTSAIVYYTPPISLVASAVIARYIYFYAFSSTRMNRPAYLTHYEPDELPDPVTSRLHSYRF